VKQGYDHQEPTSREVQVHITPRSDWKPKAPLVGAMRLPARGVFVHHSVSTPSDDLVASMRAIERTGIQRFGRFSYSYACHPTHGVVEGAGRSVGAHTGGRSTDNVGWNHISFGFCFIGNYEHLAPTDAQVQMFGDWCQQMVADGALVTDFFVSPHRDVKATACPGRNNIARWDDLVAAARGHRSNPTAATIGDDVIGPGSTGEAVEDLQAILWMWTDPSVVVNGTFDDVTAEASQRHKAMLAPVVSRPHWVDPATPLWSYRTFSMHFEFEQMIRALTEAMGAGDPDGGGDGGEPEDADDEAVPIPE
jgi:hypothetical protein